MVDGVKQRCKLIMMLAKSEEMAAIIDMTTGGTVVSRGSLKGLYDGAHKQRQHTQHCLFLNIPASLIVDQNLMFCFWKCVYTDDKLLEVPESSFVVFTSIQEDIFLPKKGSSCHERNECFYFCL